MGAAVGSAVDLNKSVVFVSFGTPSCTLRFLPFSLSSLFLCLFAFGNCTLTLYHSRNILAEVSEMNAKILNSACKAPESVTDVFAYIGKKPLPLTVYRSVHSRFLYYALLQVHFS